MKLLALFTISLFLFSFIANLFAEILFLTKERGLSLFRALALALRRTFE